MATAICVMSTSCFHKEEEATSDMVSFSLTSDYEGTVSVFSNSGSTVRDVTFKDGKAKAEFPGNSTVLIAVAPSLGLTDCRASSVSFDIPANQTQSTLGEDEGSGAYYYCKSSAKESPVHFELEPMVHTVAVSVSGIGDAKLRGANFSSATAGLVGTTSVDLFKKGIIETVDGGGRQVGVSLAEEASITDEGTIFMHVACGKYSGSQIKVVTSDGHYTVTLSAEEHDFSEPGQTLFKMNLDKGEILVDGQADAGATVVKLEGGDFNPLIILDDEELTEDRIPDFSRVGYKYGDEAIPTLTVKATIDEAAIAAAIANKTAADTTDFIQQTIDRVGYNGGGAILFKKGTYNVSRILFLDYNNTVLRGESEKETIIKYNSTIQAPIIFMGKSQLKTASDKESEYLTFVSGRRVGISKMMAMGTGGTSSFGSVYIITYSPKNSTRTYGSNSVIIEDYVPLGRLYVEVMNPNLFKTGDAVCIYRQPTQSWLDDIGMTRIASNGREAVGSPTSQWTVAGYTMRWTRKVVAVRGNRVYLDAPVAQSLESRYGGGELQKYTQERVTGSGVEYLTFDCKYDTSVKHNGEQVDEHHAWQAVMVKSAEHCWIRNVTSRHMGYALADLGNSARCITVESCSSHTPVSAIQGARRYAYCYSGGSELCLVKDCYCDNDRHSFVTNGTALGPNVFTNCKSEQGNASVGPHWGWATATLFDCIDAQSPFEAQDGGNQGTGHGWRGVNTVFWNITSNGRDIVSQSIWTTCPYCGKQWNRTEICDQCGKEIKPTARNYAVGCNGIKTSHTVYWDKDYYGNATSDFFVDLYGWGEYGYNRPDGAWYPSRKFSSTGGEFISLPYEAPVPWWPVFHTSNFSKPLSLYQCQLEDRHARGIFLNNL